MAMVGKYHRVDGRRSSNYCSKVTVVVFVAFCLAGLWMLMPTDVGRLQNSEMQTTQTLDQFGQKRNMHISTQFEDISGNLSEEGTRADGNTEKSEAEIHSDLHENNENPTNAFKNIPEEHLKDKTVGENLDERVEFENEFKREAGNDGDVKMEDMESNSQQSDSNSETEEQKLQVRNGSMITKTFEKPEESVDGKSDSENVARKQEKVEEVDQNNRLGQVDIHTEEKIGNEFKREVGNVGYRKMEDMESNSQQSYSNSETDERKLEVRNGGMITKALEKPEESLDEKSYSKNVVRKQEKVDQDNQQSHVDIHTEEKIGKSEEKVIVQNTSDNGSTKTLGKRQNSIEILPDGDLSEILNETTTQNGAWSTQATESENEKKSQQSTPYSSQNVYDWKFCNVSDGPDYIPCLDNWQAIKKLMSTNHYEHRERHCPDEAPTCLVPLPNGYKRPVKWPQSREKIWYYNVPHTKLAEIKGHQNWVKVSGEYLSFPGGGTQFMHGALHYIDFIEESLPEIAWGKKSRVVLDVGCGVASFGGYLFDRDVLAMSFAPKDEHEAQVQFALERGIPAISAVMGTTRLPFPGMVFDVVHCARCRVQWHIEGGKLLLELNRLLRPGGYFVWSATPVYRKLPEDVGIWKAMSRLTKSICWNLMAIKKDRVNGVGAAIFKKPTSNVCYESRSRKEPPLCEEDDDPNAAWNVSLVACVHRVPEEGSKRGGRWPENWPARLEKVPSWVGNLGAGVYGRAAPEDLKADFEHWKRVVSSSYLRRLGIDWSSVRNVMDMRAVYGGFAASLKGLRVWVMNVVPIDSPDTLPMIYERGLFGIYHDWCESFSTYPRSYDLLHADHLFSNLKHRCKLKAVMAEVDRLLRPEGKLIARDDVKTMGEVEGICRSLRWEIGVTYSKDNERMICVQKTMWRPALADNTLLFAIA